MEAKARADCAEAATQAETETSLMLGLTRVQDEYDRNVARLGPRFARGDGESELILPCLIVSSGLRSWAETGRMQLLCEIVTLQQTVITLLQTAVATGSLDMSGLIHASDARRNGVIQVLAHQFQRMAISAPIRPPPRAGRLLLSSPVVTPVCHPLHPPSLPQDVSRGRRPLPTSRPLRRASRTLPATQPTPRPLPPPASVPQASRSSPLPRNMP